MKPEESCFSSPSEILDSYIREFEIRSCKSRSNHHVKSANRQVKLKKRDRHRHVESVRTCGFGDLATRLLSEPPSKSKGPIEQVEKLISGLSFKIAEYKDQMMSTVPPRTDNKSCGDETKSRFNLVESVQSFKDSSSSSSSSYSCYSSSTLNSQSTLKLEDPVVVDKDPYLKCLSKFQELNKRLGTLVKPTVTSTAPEPVFDSPSTISPLFKIKKQVVFDEETTRCEQTPFDETSHANDGFTVYPTRNKCVQNFINECIKITDEIPPILSNYKK